MAVLRAAGALKRRYPVEDEFVLMLRAIIDAFVPPQRCTPPICISILLLLSGPGTEPGAFRF